MEFLLKMSLTCCLDVLLMSLAASLKECKWSESDFDSSPKMLYKCLKEMSEAANIDEVQQARGRLVLEHNIFKNHEIVSSPLQSTDRAQMKFDLCIDASDILLAEKLLGESINLFERYRCEWDKCPGN
jgi:hypothetical protein